MTVERLEILRQMIPLPVGQGRFPGNTVAAALAAQPGLLRRGGVTLQARRLASGEPRQVVG